MMTPLLRICRTSRPRAVRLAVLLAALCAPALRAEVSREYQVKAAFLYNFTKFVEWPAARLADDSAPLVIAVLGADPFGDELQKVVHGRKVHGRDLRVVATRSIAVARRAHVVFVAGDGRGLAARLAALEACGALTVGESPRFTTLGGMIRFTRDGDKVRFEINATAAEAAGLKVSSQLQKLATVVHRAPGK